MDLLAHALEIPPQERPAFLEQACGDDPALRREVDALLASADNDPGFLAEPAFSIHAQDPDTGRRIGPYRLIRLLGRGGMGAVYLAVREGDFRQQVALKLIKRGMDTDEIVRRFQHERQILADLQHPNIARLLEGGSTPEGLPYFAMEYIEGEPILDYCNRPGRELSVHRRLEIFCRVCAAVQAAHQHLVVHCDLKPGNILVDAAGDPHLLDFGIAKLLQPGPGSAPLTLLPEHRPMTPGYASPEQVQGQRVTTASDVYSLGVVLYELLTGSTPYRLDTRTESHRVLMFCEDEPPRPSSVVKRLAGDLDAIILKAMRKEPRQRYGSAAELADEIRCHLTGRPVLARRGTFTYRIGKLLWRNRLALAAVFLIVAFSVVTTVQWRRAIHGEKEALRSQQKAEQVTEFLVDIFRAPTPNRAKGKEVTARELLDRGRYKLAELADEPAIYAELTGVVGRVFLTLGYYKEARELLEESRRAHRKLHGVAHPSVTAVRSYLAGALFHLGSFELAEKHFREVYRIRRQELGDRHPEVLRSRSNLAAAQTRRGKYEDAREIYQDCLEIRRELLGPDHRKVATTLNNLGTVLYNLDDLTEAEKLLHQALAMRRHSLGPEHTAVATTLNNLGMVLFARGDSATAEGFYLEALRIQNLRLGDDHIHTAATERNLAWLLAVDGRLGEAEPLIRHALDIFQQTLPEGHWWIADAKSVLGGCLTRQERYAEAEPLLVESCSALRGAIGERAAATRMACSRLCAHYTAWGKPDPTGDCQTVAQAG